MLSVTTFRPNLTGTCTLLIRYTYNRTRPGTPCLTPLAPQLSGTGRLTYAYAYAYFSVATYSCQRSDRLLPVYSSNNASEYFRSRIAVFSLATMSLSCFSTR